MDTGKKACCGAGTCESVPVPCFLSPGLLLLSEIRSFSIAIHLDTLVLKSAMFLSRWYSVGDVHFAVKVLLDEVAVDLRLNVDRGRIGRYKVADP
jgi:hypothetical protein